MISTNPFQMATETCNMNVDACTERRQRSIYGKISISKKQDKSYLGVLAGFHFSVNLKLFNIKRLRKKAGWMMPALSRWRQDTQTFKAILYKEQV